MYITVDCERSNLTVSQALFLDPFPQQLQAIQPVNHSTNTTIPELTHVSRSIGHGAVAGVGVGAVVVLILMVALVALAHRLRGHRSQKSRISELGAPEVRREKNADHDVAIWIPELQHKNRPRSSPELGGTALSRFELGGSPSRPRKVHLAESDSTARHFDVFPLVLEARLREYVACKCISASYVATKHGRHRKLRVSSLRWSPVFEIVVLCEDQCADSYRDLLFGAFGTDPRDVRISVHPAKLRLSLVLSVSISLPLTPLIELSIQSQDIRYLTVQLRLHVVFHSVLARCLQSLVFHLKSKCNILPSLPSE